jgi:hypothetical protein
MRPIGRVLTAALAMVFVIKAIDAVLAMPSQTALIILIPSGVVAYGTMCWILNVAKARQRLIRVFEMARGVLAGKSSA